ncbi:MAG: HlyD family efflux transporter periplasmic adaptor subunit, partial [Candidatus Aenigmarchaeota archaeon]|nr:HlyD family efflux transporter periplasmic adaptor subunit [Candidatus Aenigmarchaeota archaeon]
FFGKVDVVITARGMVIPDGEVKIIQPLDTGVIREILVKEGDFVKKSAILMEIDPSTTEPALESKEENLKTIQLEIQRLDSLANLKPFTPDYAKYNKELIKNQQDIYNSTLAGYNEQLKLAYTEKTNYKNLLASSEEREARLQKVLDIIAKDEYIEEVNKINSYKAEITKLNDEISYIKETFKSENLKEFAEKQKQITQLKAEVDQIKFRNTKQKIISPVDGHVDKIFMHTVGGVVTPAQQLISITPVEVPLLVKAQVLNKDIGFVKEDMNVKIKIDTFSFQKYGLLAGKVINVSKSSIMDEKLGPVYEVFIEPLETKLVVEGKEELISSGMSASAEIKTGKRRIIEFFIYPLIKYLDEGISVR